ncbi:MAG: hypothetical protein R3B52_01615 [Candidatus Paceibacterota bacterium]
MLIKYLIFCFGAALVQGAYGKQPGPGGVSPLDAPLWFSSKTTKITLPILATLLLVAEIVLGFVLIAWWAGLFLWIPALIFAGAFLPGSPLASNNPATPFLIGMILVIGSIVSLIIW